MPAAKPGMRLIPTDAATLSSMEDRDYTVNEVADIFEASPWTVRQWVRTNQIIATRGTTKQGHKISRQALVDFAIKRYMS